MTASVDELAMDIALGQARREEAELERAFGPEISAEIRQAVQTGVRAPDLMGRIAAQIGLNCSRCGVGLGPENLEPRTFTLCREHGSFLFLGFDAKCRACHDAARREAITADPELRKLWREALWLRDLLTRVAQDLERLACQSDRSEEDRRVLLQRAVRVRQRLHEDPPPDWTPVRLGGMGDDEG